MIFQGEMKIFRMVSYKSLDFGALILGINSLLIIKTFLQMLYIKIVLLSAESFKKGCCQLQAKVCAWSTG